MLVAKNVHKSFGKGDDVNHVLNGVDVTIEPGKISVLIGPSGSGKTTLLRALSLIDLPDQGEVRVDEKSYQFPLAKDEDGDPIAITPPWPYLTVVFQQLFLWPHMTLRENILLPARNLKDPSMESRLEELIEAFQMRHFIDRYPNEASTGQRQRVALARAIMLNSRYILMDEITSALDVEQIHRIQEFLPSLKDHGIGVMIITHQLQFARRAADQILFMDQGKIIEAGGVEVIDNPQNSRTQEFLSVIKATH